MKKEYKFQFRQSSQEAAKLLKHVNIVKLLFVPYQDRIKYYQEMNLDADDAIIVSGTINQWIQDIEFLSERSSISTIKSALHRYFSKHGKMPPDFIIKYKFS